MSDTQTESIVESYGPSLEAILGSFFSDQICCDALHGSFQDIVGCDR